MKMYWFDYWLVRIMICKWHEYVAWNVNIWHMWLIKRVQESVRILNSDWTSDYPYKWGLACVAVKVIPKGVILWSHYKKECNLKGWYLKRLRALCVYTWKGYVHIVCVTPLARIQHRDRDRGVTGLKLNQLHKIRP